MKRSALRWLLLLLFLVGAVLVGRRLAREQDEIPTPTPAVVERIVPTPTGSAPAPQREPSRTATPTVSPTPTSTPAGPEPTATLAVAQPTAEFPLHISADASWRYGVVDRMSNLSDFDISQLGVGWYLHGLGGDPPPEGTDFLYLIPVQGDTVVPPLEYLRDFIAQRPGSIWQVGNEPDVPWQSNSTPEQYARVYRQLYMLVKQVDPTATLAAGAISQPTPLRRQYLDQILAEYQRQFQETMPVDVWAIHAAVLREERDTWGVDIPPGLPDAVGQLVEVQDNDRLDLLQQQLVDLRTWMRDEGYQDRPLIVTEFSILMPFTYGYDTQRVATFMTGAMDFMRTAADLEVGYPADEYRLVQRWAWYSVVADDYPTGNLFDPRTGQLTALGRIFADYTQVIPSGE